MQYSVNIRHTVTGKMENKNVRLVLQHGWGMSRLVMLRVFPPTSQTCLATNQVTAGCEALSQKVEKSSTFCNKICKCCTFYPSTSLVLPFQGQLVLHQVTLIPQTMWRIILSNQKSVFTQIATTWYVVRWVVKLATLLSISWNKSHVFFTLVFKLTQYVLSFVNV